MKVWFYRDGEGVVAETEDPNRYGAFSRGEMEKKDYCSGGSKEIWTKEQPWEIGRLWRKSKWRLLAIFGKCNNFYWQQFFKDLMSSTEDLVLIRLACYKANCGGFNDNLKCQIWNWTAPIWTAFAFSKSCIGAKWENRAGRKSKTGTEESITGYWKGWQESMDILTVELCTK